MLEFSQFDRRRYPTVSVREGYREWLPSYETTVEDEMDLVLLQALESIPWTTVARAADLGCGTSRTGEPGGKSGRQQLYHVVLKATGPARHFIPYAPTNGRAQRLPSGSIASMVAGARNRQAAHLPSLQPIEITVG